MSNRSPAFEVQALRAVASVSHSFSGDVAVPGSLQLRPMTASGMACGFAEPMVLLTACSVDGKDIRDPLLTSMD